MTIALVLSMILFLIYVAVYRLPYLCHHFIFIFLIFCAFVKWRINKHVKWKHNSLSLFLFQIRFRKLSSKGSQNTDNDKKKQATLERDSRPLLFKFNEVTTSLPFFLEIIIYSYADCICSGLVATVLYKLHDIMLFKLCIKMGL